MSSDPPPLPYATPHTPPPAPSTPPPAPPPALTPDHLALLHRAQSLYRPIRRAANYARFESITLAVFGVLTLVGGATPPLSPTSLFIGLVLTATGIFEFQTAAKLRQLDLRAPTRLALNQLVLAAGLLIYAVFRLLDIHTHSQLPAELQSQLATSGLDTSDLNDLTTSIMSLVYYSLIFVALLGCGLTAVYYRTRRTPLQTYLHEIPDWARALTR